MEIRFTFHGERHASIQIVFRSSGASLGKRVKVSSRRESAGIERGGRVERRVCSRDIMGLRSMFDRGRLKERLFCGKGEVKRFVYRAFWKGGRW